MPLCINCIYSQPESSLINGQWIKNGKRFCYASGSTANGDSFDQQCPTGEIECSEFKLAAEENIQVVNKYKHIKSDSDIYIGRGSPLGNPYTGTKDIAKTKATYQCGSREESISLYKLYLLEAIQRRDLKICAELNRVWTMARKGKVNLVCYCSPQPCHGDVIKQIIEAKLQPVSN